MRRMHNISTRWPQDLRWILLGLVLLVGWETLGAEMAVSHWYGNAQDFAWRDAWFTRTVLHDGGRRWAGPLFSIRPCGGRLCFFRQLALVARPPATWQALAAGRGATANPPAA
jgi:hypothetical protein